MPQIPFVSKLKRYFSFIEILSKNFENSCSLLVKNTAMHRATLPTGLRRYIEIAITTVNSFQVRCIEINPMIRTVNKPTEVTYVLLTPGEKTTLTHWNHLNPYYPEEPLLFPHIQYYNEGYAENFHDSDTKDRYQNDL